MNVDAFTTCPFLSFFLLTNVAAAAAAAATASCLTLLSPFFLLWLSCTFYFIFSPSFLSLLLGMVEVFSRRCFLLFFFQETRIVQFETWMLNCRCRCGKFFHFNLVIRCYGRTFNIETKNIVTSWTLAIKSWKRISSIFTVSVSLIYSKWMITSDY